MSVGIVCEFNPFHLGHQYIISKARSMGEVICVMSGPMVQRGEFACASKYDRTFAALMGGADAVVELPVRFVLSAAKNFALGAVETLKHIHGVDRLAFGVECEPELLYEIASIKRKNSTNELIKKELDNGVSYPTAVKNALKSVSPKYGEALLPNNILALEYLDALDGTNIAPMPIRRLGGGYNDLSLSGEFASASAIRNAFARGENCDRFMPLFMRDKIRFVDKKLLDKMVHFALLSRSIDEFRLLPDIEQGFEFALYDAARMATLDEAIEKLKSKRYTYARIRRILLSALLGITKELDQSNIKTRVLGIKKSFAAKLSYFDGNSIIVRNCEATKEFRSDKNVMTDCLAQDIHSLLLGEKPNEYYSRPMIVV